MRGSTQSAQSCYSRRMNEALAKASSLNRVSGAILGDWGSTRLRLWREERGEWVLSGEGQGVLAARDECAEVLAEILAAMGESEGATVWLCGMAGARIGLLETPYLPVPASAGEWRAAFASTGIAGHRVRIAPGLRSPDAATPDVMRGEETQIFGALALEGDAGREDALFLCPGTHSKWARVEGERIIDFTTVPTGEMYARLLGSSLAVAGAEQDDAGFEHGLSRAGDGVAALFEARAAQLLQGKGDPWARGYLSGLVIGMELHAMKARFADAGIVNIIGDAGLAELYSRALRVHGVKARCLPADRCTLAGLELALDD